MKALVLLLVTLVAAAQTLPNHHLNAAEWAAYKTEYKKMYKNNAEERSRLKVFLENKRLITKHNAKYEQGLLSYKLGLNKYSDMTHDEFIRSMDDHKTTTSPTRPQDNYYGRLSGSPFVAPTNIELPNTVDWRKLGAVTEVKEQGSCGSCWAFSATGALEGQHFLKTGKLVSLSEQNLVDCSGEYGNLGCGGGWINNAFEYIKENGGIDTEQGYPYEAEGGECRYDPKNRGASIIGCVDIAEFDEEELKVAVATVGPVSVSIDGFRENFQHYKSGIYYEPNCSTFFPNHAVLVVGYGIENGTDYWLVKNSWGTTWGENGYAKMQRNKNNHCGFAFGASYPLV